LFIRQSLSETAIGVVERGRTVSKTKNMLMGVLLAFVAIAGLMVLSSGTASAHTGGGNATPYNQGGESWSNNGCTAVPDSGWHWGARFDFRHACVHHDGCYGGHWASRSTCDEWFWNDMYAWLSRRHRQLCYDIGYAYYRGVRNFGSPFYNNRSISARMSYYA
jgi:hypothetical protein